MSKPKPYFFLPTIYSERGTVYFAFLNLIIKLKGEDIQTSDIVQNLFVEDNYAQFQVMKRNAHKRIVQILSQNNMRVVGESVILSFLENNRSWVYVCNMPSIHPYFEKILIEHLSIRLIHYGLAHNE